ncbi:hypothetical protein B566_EDAN019455, partial [Ephemera danica]
MGLRVPIGLAMGIVGVLGFGLLSGWGPAFNLLGNVPLSVLTDYNLAGIQDVEDAKLAVASGADALIVSNHGGRQLDGAQSSIEALPAIVQAVGSQIEVHMDGGVRSGQDVLKALALGAKGTYIGRSMLYGLGAMGQAGVTKALEIIHKELDLTMAFCGRTQVSQVDTSMLLPGTFPNPAWLAALALHSARRARGNCAALLAGVLAAFTLLATAPAAARVTRIVIDEIKPLADADSGGLATEQLAGRAFASKLYQVVYRSEEAYVLGIGFAAWRDVATFFKTAQADDSGTPNPLAGLVTHSIARGVSQSGNYLRGWLHLGFNQDESGQSGKPVHDGLWPIIAGRRIALNFRWAQPDGVLELYQA